MKNNIFLDGLRSVARVGETAVIAARAGIKYATEKPSNAKLMRETTHEVLNALGLHDDPLFKLAMALEKVALEDEYFVQRKLYPNVDFYSGIVQRAIGIPTSLFTGIFALARTVGWIAQWNEMISDPEQKIGRPRQLFVGAKSRDVPPIGARK